MRYTILTLPSRRDRHFIATTQALSVGVPEGAIHYHIALDDEQTGAEDRDAVIAAAVSDGFPFFEKVNAETATGKIYYMWNLCRFCREVIEKDLLTFFIHDGSKIRNYDLYGELYDWLTRTWKILEGVATPVTLSTTHLWQQFIFGAPLETVDETAGFVLRGNYAPDTWGRIYTPAFAEKLLQRLADVIGGIGNDPQFQIFFPDNHEDLVRVREMPGAFSGIVGFSRDTPSAFLGSDSADMEAYQHEYGRFFNDGS